jgi:hypothetical protein
LVKGGGGWHDAMIAGSNIWRRLQFIHSCRS